MEIATFVPDMEKRFKVLAISGSTRKSSSNLHLINAINEMFKDEIDFRIFTSIDQIPHFNPDLDNDTPPLEVTDFRKLIAGSDGVLICTPEYAMGVPGTLKNAIDWTVSSAEFSHKPVALITASSIGEKGHRSLLETLRIIESHLPDSLQLLISFIKTKINTEGNIIDDNTRIQIVGLINSFISIIRESKNIS